MNPLENNQEYLFKDVQFDMEQELDLTTLLVSTKFSNIYEFFTLINNNFLGNGIKSEVKNSYKRRNNFTSN
jgi:hypothetical protein